MSDTVSRMNAALQGRYLIEREIGEGGMATVYLADDLRHERKVALKVLKPELAAAVGAKRFLAEIRTTAGLQHPHILPLYDSGEADGFLFYVMPYVEGESLQQRLDREGQLPVPEAVRIASDLAEALDYAHRNGIVHRDIKPANILLVDRMPVISDFGIALAMGAADGRRLTETGLSLGTPRYMSPEQVTGDRQIGPRSDIYSLGCVLYEMLAGRPPFTGTAQAILGMIVSGKVVPVTEHRSSVPLNVDSTVRRALESLPADRFASARDFADSLANPGFRHGDSPGPPATAGPWRWIAGFATASTVVLGVGLVWLISRPEPPRPVTRVSVQAPRGQSYNGSLALSRDGTFLVYSAEASEDNRLWLRRWSSMEAVPLEGTQGAIAPAISPDDRTIAFSSPAGVRVTSVQSGTVRTLAQGSLAGTTWSQDGRWVYFADLFTGLKKVPAEGGPVEIVTAVDSTAGESGHADPQMLPGDRGLLFGLVDADAVWVAVADLRSGEVRRLIRGTSARYSVSGHLLFLDHVGTLLAAPFDTERLELGGTPVPVASGLAMANPPRGFFALSETGTLAYLAGGFGDASRPVWVSRDGSAVLIDPAWRLEGLACCPRLSPSADRLALSVQAPDGSYNIWIKRLDDGPYARLTFDGFVNRPTDWLPDGQSVSFISTRSGGSDLWVRRADGGGVARVLLDRSGTVSDGTSSADGSWLVFREVDRESGVSGIYALRPGLDSIPRPLIERGEFSLHSPALSPDGRWLAYVSDESGREEVYVRPFPEAGSGQWIVSRRGGTEPVWSPGGNELFFRDGADDLVAARVSEGSPADWSQERLFSAAAYRRGGVRPALDVTPDGERFVLLKPDGEGPWQLILVQNFFEELKRLAPD